MSRRLPPALPRQQGTTTCLDCNAHPGQQHNVRCVEVPTAVGADYMAWDPDAKPSRRSRVTLLAALTVLSWALIALTVWSFQ